MEEMKQRMNELERRVALLEGANSSLSANTEGANSSLSANILLDEIPVENRSTSLVKINISKKRYDPSNLSLGTYENHIWFNVTYTAGTLAKPTRALKGILCFSDIFGEVKLRINVTVNDRLDSSRPLVQEGIGFTYNQFLPEHQWMLATKELDMKSSFHATNVIYVDGTSETFV